MYFVYYLLPALCMIPVGIYLYFYLKRMAGWLHLDTKKLWIKLLAAGVSAFFALLASNIWGIWAVIVLHLVTFVLVTQLLYFLCRKIITDEGASRCLTKVYQCGLVPIICTVLVLGYGYWNMGHVVETRYTIHTEKEIREEGYQVAMISDLHYGTTMGPEKLERICREIGDMKPDLVILDGDIVDEATGLGQLQEAVGLLGSIPSTYGTFYVYGNHDKALYVENPDFTPDQLLESLEGAGIKVLRDESYQINGEFSIIGRDDRANPVNGGRLSSEALLNGVDRTDFLLLLDHQPCELEENKQAGYDLQLSGHTHGGQIWPMGVFNGRLGFGEMNYGYRNMDGFQVIVSSGMAGWGYPVRTGSSSEFVTISILNP